MRRARARGWGKEVEVEEEVGRWRREGTKQRNGRVLLGVERAEREGKS